MNQDSSHSATCLFCRIGARSVPSHDVFDNARIFAFLDIHPIRPGHVQIIPKRHYDYFDDLPKKLAAEILGLGQEIARVQKKIFGVERVGFLFTGGDVAHAHAHVVPLVTGTDITSRRYIAETRLTFRDAPRAANADLAQIASEISGELQQP
ncbi:MAG: HIT family protein [Phyllobacterium sp.]